MPIISDEELRKNVRIRYDTDMEELEASIKVTATVKMHHADVCTIEEPKYEAELIRCLRQLLRNLGGVE